MNFLPRWTIEALADKFRIRRQRVLSILALKEMEAHAMEQGRLMKGAMTPYRYTINLDDVHLDPNTGDPVDLADLVAMEGQVMAEMQEAAAAAAGGDQVRGGCNGLGWGLSLGWWRYGWGSTTLSKSSRGSCNTACSSSRGSCSTTCSCSNSRDHVRKG